jgi:predicted NBD/HSP70 family sugar kinase
MEVVATRSGGRTAMPTGPGEILALIRQGRALTRGDVLAATGLSRVTVAQRIDALLAAGIIVEGDTTESTGGRRRRRLVFNAAQSHVLSAAVETTHTRVAVTDLRGAVVAEELLDVGVDRGPSTTLDVIADGMGTLLGKSGMTAGDLCGTGISVPGPVDPVSGRPSEPPMLPGWDAYPIAEHLGSVIPDVPVLTANDADALAVGEYAAGFPHARSLCAVKVSTGIGTGIVIQGRSYTGVDGGAGDIGHVRVSPQSDALCRCGAHGCLAAVASGGAVARQLTDLGIPASSGREVRQLLRSGNPEASMLTQQAGRRIGEVMATAVCLLNPEVVIVAGDLASTPLLAGIRETLYRLALPRATRHLTLRLGTLGDDAPIVGLTRMVVDREFAPAAVDQRLRG